MQRRSNVEALNYTFVPNVTLIEQAGERIIPHVELYIGGDIKFSDRMVKDTTVMHRRKHEDGTETEEVAFELPLVRLKVDDENLKALVREQAWEAHAKHADAILRTMRKSPEIARDLELLNIIGFYVHMLATLKSKDMMPELNQLPAPFITYEPEDTMPPFLKPKTATDDTWNLHGAARVNLAKVPVKPMSALTFTSAQGGQPKNDLRGRRSDGTPASTSITSQAYTTCKFPIVRFEKQTREPAWFFDMVDNYENVNTDLVAPKNADLRDALKNKQADLKATGDETLMCNIAIEQKDIALYDTFLDTVELPPVSVDVNSVYLFAACRQGNIEWVKSFVKDLQDSHYAKTNSEHDACSYSYVALNADHFERTVLELAIKSGNVALVGNLAQSTAMLESLSNVAPMPACVPQQAKLPYGWGKYIGDQQEVILTQYFATLLSDIPESAIDKPKLIKAMTYVFRARRYGSQDGAICVVWEKIAKANQAKLLGTINELFGTQGLFNEIDEAYSLNHIDQLKESKGSLLLHRLAALGANSGGNDDIAVALHKLYPQWIPSSLYHHLYALLNGSNRNSQLEKTQTICDHWPHILFHPILNEAREKVLPYAWTKSSACRAIILKTMGGADAVQAARSTSFDDLNSKNDARAYWIKAVLTTVGGKKFDGHSTAMEMAIVLGHTNIVVSLLATYKRYALPGDTYDPHIQSHAISRGFVSGCRKNAQAPISVFKAVR